MRADRTLPEALSLQRAYDKQRAIIKPGFHIRLTEGMAVEGHRDGIVERVDGGDIYVSMHIRGKLVTGIHRYANEMEVVCTEPDSIAAAAEKDSLDRVSLEQHFSTCPAERLIADALTDAGIGWQHESHPDRRNETPDGVPMLDFKLDNGIYIEVKLMHTSRVERQLAFQHNAIVVQGMPATRWLADLIRTKALWDDAAMEAREEYP